MIVSVDFLLRKERLDIRQVLIGEIGERAPRVVLPAACSLIERCIVFAQDIRWSATVSAVTSDAIITVEDRSTCGRVTDQPIRIGVPGPALITVVIAGVSLVIFTIVGTVVIDSIMVTFVVSPVICAIIVTVGIVVVVIAPVMSDATVINVSDVEIASSICVGTDAVINVQPEVRYQAGQVGAAAAGRISDQKKSKYQAQWSGGSHH